MKAVTNEEAQAPIFKVGSLVRLNHFNVFATVLNAEDPKRVVLLYFDNNGVAHDLFLPPETFVLVREDAHSYEEPEDKAK